MKSKICVRDNSAIPKSLEKIGTACLRHTLCLENEKAKAHMKNEGCEKWEMK